MKGKAESFAGVERVHQSARVCAEPRVFARSVKKSDAKGGKVGEL